MSRRTRARTATGTGTGLGKQTGPESGWTPDWTAPIYEQVTALGPVPEAVWIVLHSAQRAILTLAGVRGLPPRQRRTFALADDELTEALQDLEGGFQLLDVDTAAIDALIPLVGQDPQAGLQQVDRLLGRGFELALLAMPYTEISTEVGALGYTATEAAQARDLLTGRAHRSRLAEDRQLAQDCAEIVLGDAGCGHASVASVDPLQGAHSHGGTAATAMPPAGE